MKNKLLAITRNIIPYVRELREHAGSVTSTLYMQQLEYWFDKFPDGFYKYLSPPKEGAAGYKKGDSWSEELGFSLRELKSAWSNIGVTLGSMSAYKEAVKNSNPFLKEDGSEAFYCAVYDRLNHITWYYRNHDKVDETLNDLISESVISGTDKSASPENTKAHLPKVQNVISGTDKSAFRYTDPTTETTTDPNKISPSSAMTDMLDPEPINYFDSQQQIKTKESNQTTPSQSKVSETEKIDRPPAACGNVEKRQLPRGGHDPQGFEAFWQQYPRKTAKANAQSAWNRLKADADLQATILHDLAQRKQVDHQWRDVAFVPHPATYLNGQRWQDEIIKPSAPPPVPRHAAKQSDDEAKTQARLNAIARLRGQAQ